MLLYEFSINAKGCIFLSLVYALSVKVRVLTLPWGGEHKYMPSVVTARITISGTITNEATSNTLCNAYRYMIL